MYVHLNILSSALCFFSAFKHLLRDNLNPCSSSIFEERLAASFSGSLVGAQAEARDGIPRTLDQEAYVSLLLILAIHTLSLNHPPNPRQVLCTALSEAAASTISD